MILSQIQLEEMAATITEDFNVFLYGGNDLTEKQMLHPMPIDLFATKYLGLGVSYVQLSPDGNICGVTAYTDTEYTICDKAGTFHTIPLKARHIL